MKSLCFINLQIVEFGRKRAADLKIFKSNTENSIDRIIKVTVNIIYDLDRKYLQGLGLMYNAARGKLHHDDEAFKKTLQNLVILAFIYFMLYLYDIHNSK